MRNEEQLIVPVIVVVATVGLSSAIWWIAKIAAKVGTIVVPLLAGITAAWVIDALSGERNMLAGLMVLPAMVGIVALGVAGTLTCVLHANLYDLDKKTRLLIQAEEHRQR